MLPSSKKWGVPLHLALAAGIAAVVFILEIATNHDGALVLDDAYTILTNQAVQRFDPGSLKSWIGAAFTSHSQIRPIPFLSFAWQWRLSGDDPFGFHLINDLLHAMSAVVLMFALLEFFALHLAEKLKERERVWLAAAGALLWALHPVQTSAVTYISQRITVLSALFGFAALYLYWNARRTGWGRGYWGAALCYLLALGSKETAATLPILVALYEWLLGKAETERARRERFIALAVALVPPLIMTAAYLAAGAGTPGGLGTPTLGFSLAERVLSAPRVYVRYVWLLLFPLFQALDYGVVASKGPLDPWTTLPALALTIGVIALAFKERRRHPLAAFCVLGFILLLAPESTVLMLHLFFEHRLYLPSALVIPALTVVLWRWLTVNGLNARAAAAVLVAAALGWGMLSGLRNRDYSDPMHLWRENLEVQPGAERARASLALLLGRRQRAKEAVDLLREGLERAPDSLLLTQQFAHALEWIGESDKALAYYERAVSLAPDSPTTHFEYGNALYRMGESVAGIDELKKAAELEGPKGGGHRRLGLWLLEQRQHFAAIDELSLALRAKLADPQVHQALGFAYENINDVAKAYEHYDAACKLGDAASCARLQKMPPPLKTRSPVP